MSSRALRQRLESLALAGVTSLPKRRQPRPQAPSPAPAPAPAPNVAAPAAAADDRGEALAIVQEQVAACQRCPELAAGRTQTVFGVGPLQPRLCFFGEAPGADEDAAGVPFVGRAGQLLTKIIEACTLSRDEVYILNVLKCRPPNNRDPMGEEVRQCSPYLLRQIELIQPRLLVAMGRFAAQALLQTHQSIGKLRGEVHHYGEQKILLVVTYHPAYLLRSPLEKRKAWDDLKKIRALLHVPEH